MGAHCHQTCRNDATKAPFLLIENVKIRNALVAYDKLWIQSLFKLSYPANTQLSNTDEQSHLNGV